jgi:hypothetical protein
MRLPGDPFSFGFSGNDECTRSYRAGHSDAQVLLTLSETPVSMEIR